MTWSVREVLKRHVAWSGWLRACVTHNNIRSSEKTHLSLRTFWTESHRSSKSAAQNDSFETDFEWIVFKQKLLHTCFNIAGQDRPGTFNANFNEISFIKHRVFAIILEWKSCKQKYQNSCAIIITETSFCDSLGWPFADVGPEMWHPPDNFQRCFENPLSESRFRFLFNNFTLKPPDLPSGKFPIKTPLYMEYWGAACASWNKVYSFQNMCQNTTQLQHACSNLRCQSLDRMTCSQIDVPRRRRYAHRHN